VLFHDTLVAVARRGHPALRRPPSLQVLKDGAFVSLRPRIEGEHPLEGMREWQRLKLTYALEVSEILEIFMVASHSDLFGIIPRSMEAVARETFGLQALGWAPKALSVPILLIWHATRDDDPAHAFLRAQLAHAVKEVVRRGTRRPSCGRPRRCAPRGRAMRIGHANARESVIECRSLRKKNSNDRRRRAFALRHHRALQ
jgi:DNA-binding transcriptional LysR family regulator